MLKRLETFTKAAAIAAKDLLNAHEIENFATGELDELEKPSTGDVAVVDQLLGPMGGAIDNAMKGLQSFLKDKKKITAKSLKATQTFHNRNIVTRSGHLKESEARNETIKNSCAEIQKAVKKAGKDSIPPDVAKRLAEIIAKAKANEKALKGHQKSFAKYEKAVNKDLAKV